MNPELVNDAVQRLAKGLGTVLQSSDPKYNRVVLVEKQTGRVAETFVDLYAPDGSSEWAPPDTDSGAELDLHDACFTPGTGSWFTATVTLYRDGRVETDFDYDSDPRVTEPQMQVPLFEEDLRRELEHYPRDPDKWPAWFLEKASEFGVAVGPLSR